MSSEITLNIVLLGVEIFDRKMATVKNAIEDWTSLWPRVANWFYGMEADQFGSTGHGRWKPLAASTRADRQRHGYGAARPILERSGKLLGSLFGGEGHVYKPSPLSLEIGSDLTTPDGRWTLAQLHQTGTKNMPARPVIGFEGKAVLWPHDASALRSIFNVYLHEVVTKANAA